MRLPWTFILTLSALVVPTAATLGWGCSRLGLDLAGWASAGIGYLARQRQEPAADQPGTTRPPEAAADADLVAQVSSQDNGEAQRWLALSQEIVEAAHGANSLGQALQRVGQTLHLHMGSRAWVCLRVDGWNGESALLRPWVNADGEAGDIIDITAIANTHRDERPLGTALSTLRHQAAQGDKELPPLSTCPWRPAQTRRVLAVPVSVEGWPLALLEFDDPQLDSAELSHVLDIAAIQLGFVAQRDANLAHMATSAEHLGRLALVASRISSGVAITDRHGTIEWINSAFVALTGWPEDKVLGRKLGELLAQEVSAPTTVRELEDHLARGVPFRLSYEAARQGGQLITRYWGEIDAIQMLDETGGRSQYVCLFNDITKRKAQEHVREQEREFLEALLGNLPVSLFVLDPVNLNVVAINRYTEIEFKLQRDQVVGKSITQALGESVLKLTEGPMQEALETGQTIEHDFEWQNASQHRIVNARHFALRHSNGRPRLLISLVRDITASRQAQADLEESERRFRELVESMDDPVYCPTEPRADSPYLSTTKQDLWARPI